MVRPHANSTYDVAEFGDLLSERWKSYALNSAGKLKWKAVIDQYNRGGTLPTDFLTAFTTKYPDIEMPTTVVNNSYSDPVDQPRTTRVRNPDESGSNVDITDNGKRKFTWLVRSWTKPEDEVNKRAADGSLLPLTTHVGDIVENNVTINPNGDIPDSLLTQEMLDHWSSVNDINGKLVYDSEKYALGSLSASEYMLVPSNMAIPECPIAAIGGGLGAYDPGMLLMAGVYCLAKEQAIALQLSETDQIKWAAIRLEGFKCGWFDHQRYTAFRPMPANSITTFVRDGRQALTAMENCLPLCAFLPFLAEFYFRSYGGCYSQTTASDYVAKAHKLAAGASLSDFLSYMNQDMLYGKALAWIGVRRPMLVLRDPVASKVVPNVFKIRATSAPAGQAIITTSATIITALRSASWWEGIARVGRYNDVTLMAVAEEIKRSPWKYHLMSYAYGLDPLTEAEKERVEEARAQAETFAPILQAYIDSVTTGHDLGRAQALKKFSQHNQQLYNNALSLFRQVRRLRGRNVADLFANTVFGVPPARIEEQPAGPSA